MFLSRISGFNFYGAVINNFSKMNANKLLYSFICVITFSYASLAQQADNTLRRARIAYNQVRLDESRMIYNEIIKSSTSTPSEKAEALQNIAMQDWMLFSDYSNGIQNLEIALQQNVEKSKTYLLISQINLEALKFPKAYEHIEKALSESTNETERIDASLLKAQIIHDENIGMIAKGRNPDESKLLLASDLLKYILQKRPGSPTPAELLLGISLIRKNGNDILKAWKFYYFITDEKNINGVLMPSFKNLKSILPKWDKQDLTTPERIKLIKALAGSNFYDYANLVATCKIFGQSREAILEDKEIIQILDFNHFIEQIDSVNNSFYPKIAIGTKNYEQGYTDAITEEAKKLWIKIGKQNTRENYTEAKFFALIEEKFGALGYIGTTNGYVSTLLGLIIHNEVKEVIQYGYKAEFRYVSISRLISKDFTTWHGSANVGGWGTETSMIQVRDAFLEAPFTRLSWVKDSTAHKEVLDKIEAAKAIDLVNCQKDKYAEPSFLKMAFRLKASENLFDSLQKTGLEDEALSIAFIKETLRQNIESTVFGHEGRHAIDQLLFKDDFDDMTDDEKELRAKFSEIVFAPKCKMANTGSILGGNLDVNTPHGKANLRLRKIIVHWMEKHSNEIVGLDANLPLIMQMDLLSDDQLVAICMEADPLARGKK